MVSHQNQSIGGLPKRGGLNSLQIDKHGGKRGGWGDTQMHPVGGDIQ